MEKIRLEVVTVEALEKRTMITGVDRENNRTLTASLRLDAFDKESGTSKKNDEKEEFTRNFCTETLGCEYENIEEHLVGKEVDFFVYTTDDGFDSMFISLYEINYTPRPDYDKVDEKFCKIKAIQEGKIEEVILSDAELALYVRTEVQGDSLLFVKRFRFSKWVASEKKYFRDPVQTEKTIKKIKEVFGIELEDENGYFDSATYEYLKDKDVTYSFEKAGSNPYIEIREVK